jgi:hypothetical protein
MLSRESSIQTQLGLTQKCQAVLSYECKEAEVEDGDLSHGGIRMYSFCIFEF